MVRIPERLREKASTNSAATRWLAELPALCERLCAQWSVRLGTAFEECHVSLVVTTEGSDPAAVLKVPMPATVQLGTLTASARAGEAAVLRLWDGDGAVRLLAEDASTGAMLVERCRPGAPLDRIGDPEAGDRVAAELLGRLHRPAPADAPFEHLADNAREFAHDLPVAFDRIGSPFDAWMIELAVELLLDLSQPTESEVLLHGDFHLDNILSSGRAPWLAIDPLPMVGDPAYDAVQYLLFRKGDLTDPHREWDSVVTRFADRLGVDVQRVKAWTFARLVSDAVAAIREGTSVAEEETAQGDLWSARLIHPETL